MVRAHDMRLVKSFDEKSGFMIDRQTERTAHAAQSARAEKTGRMLKEGGEHVAVIDRVDQWPRESRYFSRCARLITATICPAGWPSRKATKG